MKKLLLPLLLIILVSMLAAVESDPSEVVGYFRKTISDGQVQAIALPFATNDLSVATVLGDQFAADDELQDINTGFATVYYDGFGWFGDLENFEYGAGYYAIRSASNPSTDYYLMGKVDPQSFTMMINGASSVTAFGLNEARAIIIDDSLFGANPVDGDEIQEIDSGLSSVYYDGFGWFGDLENILPTYAYYYITSIDSPGFNWTYAPVRSRDVKQVLSNRKSK